jgi:biopolymer transport protein TolQ
LGFGALAEMIGNIGPIAVGVLALLLVASLYSWTVIFGKWWTFRKATNQRLRR